MTELGKNWRSLQTVKLWVTDFPTKNSQNDKEFLRNYKTNTSQTVVIFENVIYGLIMRWCCQYMHFSISAQFPGTLQEYYENANIGMFFIGS